LFQGNNLKNSLFKKNRFNDSAFGWDGLTTFIFSNLLLLLSFGLAFFWLLFKTIKTARDTKTSVSEISDASSEFRAVLVAGLCLQDNQPVEEFKVRLNRAIALVHVRANTRVKKEDENAAIKRPVILLGGMTGGNQISEAQAGADYLIAQGVNAERIILEDQSRHTLENLQHARNVLVSHSLSCERQKEQQKEQQRQSISEPVVIISSRYHLYRILTLASGLQMPLQPIAAEETFSLSTRMWLRMFKEAYYLHWYWSGKLWLIITANNKSKARIS